MSANSMQLWIGLLRGPVFWAALTFMVMGLARHLAITAWGIVRTYYRAGDKTIPLRQVWGTTARWLIPLDRLGNRLLFSISTLVFHISIIIVPIFLAGHIELWRRGIGISWPAIPNAVADALTLVAIVAAVAIVIQRAASRESRALSRFQDYAMPLVIAVPFASGFAVMHPEWNPFSLDVAMLVHLASANLLLILIPLTKLSHIVLLPGTRLISELAWHFPPDAGAKVGVELGKANKPI